MKKILLSLLSILLFVGPAFSYELVDIEQDHWAAKEIVYCIKEKIIAPYNDNTYRPETQVKRADFNSMLLRALGHKQTETINSNKFNDIDDSYWAYADILKAEKLGLLYGYPDETFKPEEYITKSEVASIVSHITKSDVNDIDILDHFSDANEIPSWAKAQYAKSIELGLYVNYPDGDYLLPNKVLDRAEAAVLFYKLRMAMGAVVQEKYVAKEVNMGTEHLRVSSLAPNNKVTVTNFKKTIQAGNLLKVNFANDYNSRRSEVGSNLNFVFGEDVITQEGSLLIPKGSTASAVVQTLEPQRALNKNAKLTLHFNKITVPSGQSVQISGRVFENDGVLSADKKSTLGKVIGYTLGGAALGAGAGVGVAAIPHPKKFGTGVAVGIPVGAGVGMVSGILAPGLPYKAHENDSLLIQLDEDLQIQTGESL